MTTRLHRAGLALALALAACAPRAPAGAPAATPPGAPAVSDRLFFGRSIPGGGMVSDAEWELFLRDVVTPRFPDGLTVWRAQGQWRGASGEPVREPVTVLEVIHPGSATADSVLTWIAAEYKRRFRQEAVLRVTLPARMEVLE